jgi:hypothetical protein
LAGTPGSTDLRRHLDASSELEQKGHVMSDSFGTPTAGSSTDLAGSDQLPAPASTRRCGRCLQQFPADPDADPVVIQEFWMCPSCRTAFLGRGSPRAGR